VTREVVLGVDVGGSKVLALVVDHRLRELGRHRVGTRRGAEGIRTSVGEAVAGALVAAAAESRHVVGTGVGVPGVVAPGTSSVSHAVNLGLGHETVDLAALLTDVAPGPVVVENDVNAAAVGVHARDPDAGDVALLSIGTGLAAGLVVDGTLRRGSTGVAGEIGHLQVDPRGPLCGCGQRGCLEAVSSGQALAREWPVPAGTSVAHAVWSAADGGSRRAQGLRNRFVAGLAAAVRTLVLSWDVPRVVLAGGVADLGEPLAEAVRGRLADEALDADLLRGLGLPARVSVLPESCRDVGALGAALSAVTAATRGATVLRLAAGGGE
jgi:predicted NBD/HSP70 family sugar kinase